MYLETKEFIENTIDTAWLDGIIKEQSVKIDIPPHLVVVLAAIHRAFQHVCGRTEDLKESFRKGQVSAASIPSINSFEVEICLQRHQVRLPSRANRFGCLPAQNWKQFS